MSKHKQPRHPAPTPPSEAVGESGDREARQAADEGVVGRVGDIGRPDGEGRSAKRRRPGTGGEERTR